MGVDGKAQKARSKRLWVIKMALHIGDMAEILAPHPYAGYVGSIANIRAYPGGNFARYEVVLHRDDKSLYTEWCYEYELRKKKS